MDSIELTLPISGSKVEIRNYTTRADDERAEQVLYAGVQAEHSEGKQAGENSKIVFPMANVMASQDSYVYRLVKAIDGDHSNLNLRLKDLRSKDYESLSEAVNNIVEEHSPKVKADKAA